LIKKIWELYKKDLTSALAIILVFVVLIYFSSLKGEFLWPSRIEKTSYFTLSQISTFSIIFSFVILFALFLFLLLKAK